MMHDWYGFGAYGWLMMLAFWGVIAAAVVVLVRGLTGASAVRAADPPQESAVDVLKRRYARGEIEREEYEQKIEDLKLT